MYGTCEFASDIMLLETASPMLPIPIWPEETAAEGPKPSLLLALLKTVGVGVSKSVTMPPLLEAAPCTALLIVFFKFSSAVVLNLSRLLCDFMLFLRIISSW